MCLYLCLFFVFISIAACLHWCGITEEIKVDIVSPLFVFSPRSPPHPPVPPPSPPPFPSLSDLLSVVFFFSFFFLISAFFFLEVAATLSHYVTTSCVSVVIMPVCLRLVVLFSPPLSLPLFPQPGCLSKSLPQRMRSFLRTTPLRRLPHISGVPGEENVAFLRGATQTEQSLQESGEGKKQTAN